MARQTGGVVWIHSTPGPLCPHVEWALQDALDSRDGLDWTPQPQETAAYRAERPWWGPVGTAARVVSALLRLPGLRFEVTEDPTDLSEGRRYSHTPELGLFQAPTTPAGDLMVTEQELRLVLGRWAERPERLAAELRQLLGDDWDDELEPFRSGDPAAPTRWLRQVV
ncbi:MAG: DUF3145 domain-containing protein [Propionibacteriaceae bacterium]|nr:DUF3145 domain-containing protein [Propionibacteriaceae bacterium]